MAGQSRTAAAAVQQARGWKLSFPLAEQETSLLFVSGQQLSQ